LFETSLLRRRLYQEIDLACFGTRVLFRSLEFSPKRCGAVDRRFLHDDEAGEMANE